MFLLLGICLGTAWPDFSPLKTSFLRYHRCLPDVLKESPALTLLIVSLNQTKSPSAPSNFVVTPGAALTHLLMCNIWLTEKIHSLFYYVFHSSCTWSKHLQVAVRHSLYWASVCTAQRALLCTSLFEPSCGSSLTPLAVARGRGPAEGEPPVLLLLRAALALCRDDGRVLEVKVTVQNILIAELLYVFLYYFFLVYFCGPGYLTVDCSKKAIFYYFKFLACLLFWFQYMHMLKCCVPVKRTWLFQTKRIPEETHRIKCVQADLISALVFHIFSMQSNCWQWYSW